MFPDGVAAGLGVCCKVDVRINVGYVVVDGDDADDTRVIEGADRFGLLLGW